MSTTETSNPIDEEQASRLRAYGQAQFEFMRAHVARVRSEKGLPEIESGQSYTDTGTVSFSGFFGIDVEMVVTEKNGTRARYTGSGGGVGLGGGDAVGFFVTDYPLSTISTWAARFQITTIPGALNMFLWGRQNEFVGTFTGTGVVIAAGASGGNGSFSPA